MEKKKLLFKSPLLYHRYHGGGFLFPNKPFFFCFLSVCIISCIFFFNTNLSAEKYKSADNLLGNKVIDINEQTTVMEIINHPLFKGYGQFLFPTEHGLPPQNMKISQIQSLLPYHSHIDTQTTIDVLNYMQNEVSQGNIIFYDIYSAAEKKADPSKKNTGLFFFRGKPNAPFAVICAGGGFSYVGSIHESFPHALKLSQKGYNAFALQYRTGSAQSACEDLAAAIAFIFKNASALGVNTNCYSLWGGSAGARMAAYLGSYTTEAFGQEKLPRPGAVIMQYTGHTDYTGNDPPTYVCVGENDYIANWKIMQRRINNLSSLGIETEFHKYPRLEHGFGLGVGTTADGWIDEAVAFWEKQMKHY